MDCALAMAVPTAETPYVYKLAGSCQSNDRPPVVHIAMPASKLSKEPFYAGLVKRARRLKHQTEGFAARPSPALLARAEFKTYARDIRALSDGDLQGHNDLKARGTDSDLKCIMKGLSLDLNIKLDAIAAAKTDADIKTALGDMAALLSDNIDVIVTPETADSGLDCVIEFGKGA